MEVRRILSDYRLYLLAVLTVLIVFIGTFYDINENELAKNYTEIVNTEYDLELMKAENEELFLRDPAKADINAQTIALLEQQQLYLDGYYDNNLSVINRTKELKERGIIKDADKILEDFARINQVEVTSGNDYSVTLITENNLINIMLCLFSVAIIFFFFDERKRGMWDFVHSTANGREHLALARVWLGIIIVTFVAIAGYLAVILADVKALGCFDIDRSIQSIESFGQFPYAINIFGFLVLFGIVKILGAIFIFLIAFLIFSIVNNRNIAILLSVLLVSIEVVLYIAIKPNSNLLVLKLYNMYSLSFGSEDFSLYQNYILFGSLPIYRLVVRILGITLGILILVVVGALANYYKRPTRESSILQTTFGNKIVGRIMAIIPNFLTEFWKQLFLGAGLVVLICVIGVGVMVNPVSTYQYKNCNSRLRMLYENCHGDIGIAKELLDELKQEFEECPSSDVMRKSMLREDISDFEQRINYIESLQTKGYKVQFIDEKPYLLYFNAASFKKIKVNMLVVIVGMILLFSNLFSYEKDKNIVLLVNSTATGKYKQYLHKAIFACVMLAIMSLFTLGRFNQNFAYDYGFNDLDKAAMTISIFSKVPFGYSIADMVLAQNVLAMVVLFSVAVVIFFLSKYCGYKKTLFIAILIFVLPLIFEFVGIDWAKYISVTNLCDITRLI